MPTIARPWTAAEDAALREMHAAGATLQEMADRLGRTWAAVKQQRWKLGLRDREPQPHKPVPVPRPRPLGQAVWGYQFDGVWYFETAGGRALGSWNPETHTVWLVGTVVLTVAADLEAAVGLAAGAVPAAVAGMREARAEARGVDRAGPDSGTME